MSKKTTKSEKTTNDKVQADASVEEKELPKATFAEATGQENLVKAELLEAAEAKAQEHWDLYVRKEAELQNTRKRAQTQLEESRRFAIHNFAEAVLPVLDSLENGLNSAQGEPLDTVMHEGLQLTHKLLLDIMTKYDISVIDPAGHPFDPAAHEALTTQPATDEIPHNHVMAVIQKGYKLSGRVLRPAKVIVAAQAK